MGARNYARLVQATGIASYNVPAASQCMDWLSERNIPGTALADTRPLESRVCGWAENQAKLEWRLS